MTTIYTRGQEPASYSAFNPARRGYVPTYRADQVNHCPGCGRSHWYIGRSSAECGFCGAILPLPDPSMAGPGTFWSRGRAA